jgi:hypothetical protein
MISISSHEALRRGVMFCYRYHNLLVNCCLGFQNRQHNKLYNRKFESALAE